MRTITLGKTRLIKSNRGRQTWIKAEISQEYEAEPSALEVKEQLDDVEFILEKEENDERAYWKSIEDRPRQLETGADTKPELDPH